MNILKKIIFIIVILVILIIGFFEIKSKKINNENNNEVEQQIENNGENFDLEVPDTVDEFEITQENQIYSSIILNEFEDGKNLTTEQYLTVVCNALANGYVTIANNESNIYTDTQINSIVYNIFGVELKENKSVNGLDYENGVYKLKKQPDDYIYEMKNLQYDAATGIAYLEFELYKEKASGEEEDIGRYSTKIMQNTVTGNMYIQSIQKKINM